MDIDPPDDGRCRLLELPWHMLLEVLHRLDTFSLCALAQTCKDLCVAAGVVMCDPSCVCGGWGGGRVGMGLRGRGGWGGGGCGSAKSRGSR